MGYYIYSFVFRDRVSPCSFGACSGSCSVDQVGLQLTEICLALPGFFLKRITT